MHYLQIGQISKVFLVFITFILTLFAAAMIYISSLQTPQEKFQSEQAKIARLNMAEDAQNLGIPLAEYKKTKEKRSRDLKHMRKIDGAIIKKDDELLAALLKEIPDFDFA